MMDQPANINTILSFRRAEFSSDFFESEDPPVNHIRIFVKYHATFFFFLCLHIQMHIPHGTLKFIGDSVAVFLQIVVFLSIMPLRC